MAPDQIKTLKDDWIDFWQLSYGDPHTWDKRYFGRESTVQQDVRNLVKDIKAGVPVAIDMYEKFLVWRVTR